MYHLPAITYLHRNRFRVKLVAEEFYVNVKLRRRIKGPNTVAVNKISPGVVIQHPQEDTHDHWRRPLYMLCLSYFNS